jgi:hypothetical protein
MRIYTTTPFDFIELVWVDSGCLDKMWSHNSDDYVAVWKGEPCPKWFLRGGTNDAFIVPVLSVGTNHHEPDITFTDGRHRTRWLISNMGFKSIPIGIARDQIDYAKQIGLMIRPVNDGDEL